MSTNQVGIIQVYITQIKLVLIFWLMGFAVEGSGFLSVMTSPNPGIHHGNSQSPLMSCKANSSGIYQARNNFAGN